jgi:hypothetical protein
MLLNEKLLQFIWQFQHFNKHQLFTTDGDELQIIHQGVLNNNQGPDFLQATVSINKIKLVGSIELHLLTSNWLKHKHNQDVAYRNVILHVVWINDVVSQNQYNLPTHTLEIQPLVPKIMLSKYETLMNEQNTLPCHQYLPALSDMAWLAWKERLATERLIEKSNKVLQVLTVNNNNWEETFWQILAYNFGLKVNADLFLETAKNVSNNTLSKHKNNLLQIEALLMGNANLLQATTEEEYEAALLKEYSFLQKKYSLKSITIKPAFLRMRPANFPTIRLAQLASLVHQSSHLFSKVKEAQDLKTVMDLFNVSVSNYWLSHYTFNKQSEDKNTKQLGGQMINTIMINAVVVVLFSYGLYAKDDDIKVKAIEWLQQLKPEDNKITKMWKVDKIENKSALDSQALLQLTNFYCNSKKCLQCAVGNAILKQTK